MSESKNKHIKEKPETPVISNNSKKTAYQTNQVSRSLSSSVSHTSIVRSSSK